MQDAISKIGWSVTIGDVFFTSDGIHFITYDNIHKIPALTINPGTFIAVHLWNKRKVRDALARAARTREADWGMKPDERSARHSGSIFVRRRQITTLDVHNDGMTVNTRDAQYTVTQKAIDEHKSLIVAYASGQELPLADAEGCNTPFAAPVNVLELLAAGRVIGSIGPGTFEEMGRDATYMSYLWQLFARSRVARQKAAVRGLVGLPNPFRAAFVSHLQKGHDDAAAVTSPYLLATLIVAAPAAAGWSAHLISTSRGRDWAAWEGIVFLVAFLLVMSSPIIVTGLVANCLKARRYRTFLDRLHE